MTGYLERLQSLNAENMRSRGSEQTAKSNLRTLCTSPSAHKNRFSADPEGLKVDEPASPLSPAFLGGEINNSSAEARLAAVVARLTECPDLVYSMNTHDDVEPDFVLLSLAIRGKGACELRIPRANYDPFKLLDLVDKLPKQAATEEIII